MNPNPLLNCWNRQLALHNAVTVSQQRLGRRVAQLSSARMNEVCDALRFSLGCDSG
jgi:mRNA-degrading endonuclease toxin of MazEF toxin-antitoxin module